MAEMQMSDECGIYESPLRAEVCPPWRHCMEDPSSTATLNREFEIYALFNKHDPSEEVMTALEILAGEDRAGECR